MTGYEELFMNDQERADLRKPKVEDIPLSELSPFKDHPFKVKEDEELERLKESIKESGVLVPALARSKADGGYELISGHRRMAACKELGLETIPVIIRELTDEESIITMVDANLQREHILPSEKAFAYKMKYEAMKRTPGRKEKYR
jgi:ParB family chromosome partitioning protein